ncbi:MAG: OmpA family protein [Candidatus Krumholzibacteriia bacterium]
MKTSALILLGLLCLAATPALAEQTDSKGCQDHPLFTRMPTYWIHGCELREFDAFVFKLGEGKTETVEGRFTKLRYYPQATAKSKPSELQIQRNYEAAVQELGGTTVHAEKSREVFRIVKDGREYWVELTTTHPGAYFLTLVEREAMKQDVTVNAEALADGLRSTGHVAVYEILFDTGKTDLKPESRQAIGEIARMLQADPALKLYVVGHTDNAGAFDMNMKLSQGRAEAVVKELAGSHAIDPARLRAAGAGPLAPVAANDTEDGRAKNRRVELVEQ